MIKIAYILLCHKDALSVVRQAEDLTSVGDFVSIHFDRRSSRAEFDIIRKKLAGNPNVVFAKRLKCGWGEWSLVRATLNALKAAEQAFPSATHFYLMSGDCMAIKPASYMRDFLIEHNKDFIECEDFFASDWIRVGLKEERLKYRHWFNERTQKKRFYASLKIQKRFKLDRNIPKDLDMRIGSQWWCLRRKTIEAILKFCNKHKDVMRFFKTTWIPDEIFFQTLVCHLIPKHEIEARTLTFLMFSDYGMPVTFFNDQYDFLLSQDYMFARKVSLHALDLKKRLAQLYASADVALNITNEGQSLYTYLTNRGRIGQRFAPRFWEKEISIGRNRQILVVICKKWHVAKRFLKAVTEQTNIKGVAYLFDESDTPLPDTGGIGTTLEKRTRHRRSFVRLLYDGLNTDQLMICLDPNKVEVLRDFYNDRAHVRTLEIKCEFTDAYLHGHAMRTGLANEQSSEQLLAQLIRTIRQDIIFEQEQIYDQKFAQFYTISDTDTVDANAVKIAAFLNVSQETAHLIAATPQLFSD